MLIYSLVARHQSRAICGVHFPKAAKQDALPWHPSPPCGADTSFPRLEKKDGKCGISLLAQISILPPVSNKAVKCCSVKLTPRKLLSKIRHLLYLSLTALLLSEMFVVLWKPVLTNSPMLFFPNLCCLLVLCSDNPVLEITWGISGSSEAFKGKFLGSWNYSGMENIIFLTSDELLPSLRFLWISEPLMATKHQRSLYSK